MGADVELVDAGFGISFKESWEKALEDVRRRGGKPYAIPAGASDHRLGGLGYVGFAEEVRAQESGARLQLRLHLRLLGHRLDAGRHGGRLRRRRARDRVIGIDASAKPEATFAQILRIAERTADLVDLGRPITRDGRRARRAATPTRPTAFPRRRPTRRSGLQRGSKA